MIEEIAEKIEFKNSFDIKSPVIRTVNARENIISVAHFYENGNEHENNESLYIGPCMPVDTSDNRSCQANKQRTKIKSVQSKRIAETPSRIYFF